MPHNRYFAEGIFSEDNPVLITEQEFHHLAHVMRAKIGDEVEIINGRGQLAKAVVEKLSKESALCYINELIEEKKPPCSLILALAFLKQSSLEFAIEKATEIGIDSFFLFPAACSQKRECSDHAVDRLKTIIRSATKQCGRLFLPTLTIKNSLKECLEHKSCYRLFGALDSTMSYSSAAPLIAQSKEVMLFIGPESGFSDDEHALFQSHSVQGMSLSPFILRAETAAIVGSTLLHHASQSNS